MHVYAQLPPEYVDATKRQSALKGVDLLCNGKAYVLAAGSLHGTGAHYTALFDPNTDKPLPLAPPNIVKLLDRTNPHPAPEVVDQSPNDPKRPRALLYMTADELRDTLAPLNPVDFSDRDKWFQVLAASHEATDGDEIAREMFAAWSTTDPEYADDYETIAYQWDKLNSTRPQQLTRKTLFKYAREAGGDVPRGYLLRESLAEFNAEDLGQPIDTPEQLKAALDDRETAFNRLVERINTSDPKDLFEGLEGIAQKAATLSIMQQGRIEVLMKQELRGVVPMKTIDRAFAQIERTTPKPSQKKQSDPDHLDDIPAEIATAYRDHLQETQRPLIHAVNGAWYQYTGKEWKKRPDHVVRKGLAKYAKTYIQTLEAESPPKVSTLLPRALVMLSTECTVDEDVFGFSRKPRAIINCESGELHIDGSTGSFRARPHDSESYQLHLVPVVEDPCASCPKMDSTLADIFEKAENPKALIDFIWEIIGYSLQPDKDLPIFPLFIGKGANGKSLIQKVMTALHGPDTVVSKDLALFADGAKNNHAMAEIVGARLILDDDLEKGTRLPTSTVKKLSEAKLLTANPKGKDSFSFIHHALMVVNANTYPKLREHTEGIMRRLYPIPFDRKFTKEQRDEKRADYIIENELSGVLNRALEGLARLRKRGDFARPVDVERALAAWIKSGNPGADFLRGNVEVQPGRVTRLDDVWKAYLGWCHDNGVDRRMTKPQLIGLLDEMEFVVEAVDGEQSIRDHVLTYQSGDSDPFGEY
jgi:P4 family phage/plasmid primase-like protien